MTDPLRSSRLPQPADVQERDARIEEFLLAGLDHYFAEQYDLAINVWTRVLFIDRGHARARAYIERARGAIAERQRKGDELLHTGTVALDRGDARAARLLVTSAVEHGASADEALALIARIDRLENAIGSSMPLTRDSASHAASGIAPVVVPHSARLRWIAVGVFGGVILGAAILAIVAQGSLTAPLFGSPDQLPVSTLNAPLPVPSTAEIALTRGQALFARGRLHEALALLAEVPDGDPYRSRADELVAAIQRQLLAAGRSQYAGKAEGASRRP
jgi:tetratricopeptide (TPR) repeat protein